MDCGLVSAGRCYVLVLKNCLVKKRIDEDSVGAYESGKWWHQVKDFKGSTKDGLGYLN